MAYRIIAIILVLSAILYDTLLKNKVEDNNLKQSKENYNQHLKDIFSIKIPKNCDNIITDSNLAEKLKLSSVQNLHPSMYSWGNMINSARLEMAREPVVWWSLAAAFIFMFILVLAANLFSDAVRDAFDPRLREF